MDQETTNLLRLQRRTLLLPSLLLPQAILVLQLHFRRLLEPLPPPATKMDHATSLSWHLLPWTIAFASEILIRGSSLSLSLSLSLPLCARPSVRIGCSLMRRRETASTSWIPPVCNVSTPSHSLPHIQEDRHFQRCSLLAHCCCCTHVNACCVRSPHMCLCAAQELNSRRYGSTAISPTTRSCSFR